MKQSTTISYYDLNAKAFSDSTVGVDFTDIQNKFMRKLPTGALVLDFGCGSGRDTKCFLENDFSVEAIDGSEELCILASEYTGIQVKHMFFQELNEVQKYDAIWACSSILHLPQEDLITVMKKMCTSLKKNGFVYTSFKYGSFEGMRNGRYFIDMTEEKIELILQEVEGFEVEETWVTSDVRPGRGEEKWLNLFLRKK